MEEDQSYRCVRCGTELGKIISDNLLCVGGLVLTTAHGFCAQCGRAFHYTTTEKQLEQLIAKVLADCESYCK